MTENKSKHTIKKILVFAAGILLILALVCGFVYRTSHKISEIDLAASSDGKYELYFQQVGDPDFPFGSTRARLVLKKDNKTIVKYSFDIANDGKNISEENWKVSWKEDSVSVIISGEEQENAQYILFFDGKGCQSSISN